MKPMKTWKSSQDYKIGLFKSEPNEQGYKYTCLWKNTKFSKEDWYDFGGSVGYTTASFKTRTEAIAFVEKGLREELKNPEVWLDMVAC